MSQFYLPYAIETNNEHYEEIIRENSLATLIISTRNEAEGLQPLISYVPLLLNKDDNVLRGHISRSNPVSKLSLDEIYDCTAIFHGPNAYISPAWYESKKETGKAVPTWNYVSVHIVGRCRFIPDSNWIYDNVSELSNHFENKRNSDWKISDAPPAYIQAMIRAVVGIEISITNIDARFKLSQNRSVEDRQAVIQNLQKANDGDDRQLAEWMEKVQVNK